MKSFYDLEVYSMSVELSKGVHFMSLKLPSFEKYELGSQVRRSAQSIRANIAEGYGRKRYKKDFIHFLIQAHGSSLETISHLEMIRDLYENFDLNDLINRYKALSSKLYAFIDYVENRWISQPKT